MGKQKSSKPGPGKPFPGISDKSSMPRRFLLPSIMLLLAEEPSHGYVLLEKLVEMGVAEARLPLPMIYRALHYLEIKKMAVSSMVKTGGRGPAKKVFRLTDKGWKELAAWTDAMRKVKDFASGFQERSKAAELLRAARA